MKRIRDFLPKRGCQPLATAQGQLSVKYRSFRNLLRHNRAAMEAMADMEQLYLSGKPFSLSSVRIRYEALLEAVYGIAHSLNTLSGKTFPVLSATIDRIDATLFENFNPKCLITTKRLVIPFEDITPEMNKTVGSKASNLAVIGNSLGLPVPQGFAVTSFGFERFLGENGLSKVIEEVLSRISFEAPEANEQHAERIRALILGGRMPKDLENEILQAFDAVEAKSAPGVRVAMRSSAVGEDTEATFAGQYETVLNVTRNDVLTAYKKVLAGKYSARAISYRMQYGLEDRETPMCVAAVVMVDARASGVLYSLDPAHAPSPLLKINSVWGLGEQLVDGSASPDTFLVDRSTGEVRDRSIAKKKWKLSSLENGGTGLREVPSEEREQPSLDDAAIGKLAGYGLLLEEFFGGPQDIEWAQSRTGELYLLQSRPLLLPTVTASEMTRKEYPGHRVLLAHGLMASPGIAAGRVFIPGSEDDLKSVPEDSILVVRTASPEYAKVMGVVKGLITDVGSVTSHMASVAREFGLPAIVDAKDATTALKTGDLITMSASSLTVYEGFVEALLAEMRPSRRPILDSPVHRRTRGILDMITPLNLVDTASASFIEEGCRTFHDVIRFTHEAAVRDMFGISEGAPEAGGAVKLASRLPFSVYLVDLGGGLKKDLTSCDSITPDTIESRPFAALWKGFTHPGVTWEGTMHVTGKVLGGLAATATSELGEQPGGDSYAVISREYLNLSAKFAYHFSTVDALCGENSSQNYISLQFSGGAGNYYGRNLRVKLMADVLERLGFQVMIKGDLLDASLARFDCDFTLERLDLLGRLLASSRLLDMTLSSQEEIETFREEFFKGNYNFLLKDGSDTIHSLYTQGGRWRRVVENGRTVCVQDGSRLGRRLTARISGAIGKVMGTAYYDFLDNIEAYYYFPLAIAKDSDFTEGAVSVRIKPSGGKIDRAGGIAFGFRSRDDYFVLRINALEDNIALFEFRNGKRYQKDLVRKKIENNAWHILQITVRGGIIQGIFNGERVIEFDNGGPLRGFVGLWTKSDSTTWFDDFIVESKGVRRRIEFS
jgi:pyruvate,water dikinase